MYISFLSRYIIPTEPTSQILVGCQGCPEEIISPLIQLIFTARICESTLHFNWAPNHQSEGQELHQLDPIPLRMAQLRDTLKIQTKRWSAHGPKRHEHNTVRIIEKSTWSAHLEPWQANRNWEAEVRLALGATQIKPQIHKCCHTCR